MATRLAEGLGATSSPPAAIALDVGDGAPLRLPDGFRLFAADYNRAGSDLVLTDPSGAEVVILDYFAVAQPPSLLAGGGRVGAHTVEALAGPRAPAQYAQTDGAPEVQPVGTVETADGEALITRTDGTQTLASEGTPIFQGDVIETGDDGSLFVVFVDGTSFAMGRDSHIVLDELIYDPEAGEGSAVISALEGTFSFVSGEIAETDPDAMIIKTPVAICGVRGTKIVVKVLDGGESIFALLAEGPQLVGEVLVSTLGGSETLNGANEVSIVENEFTAPSQPQVLSRAELSELFGTSFESLERQDFSNTEANLGDIAPAAGGDPTASAGTLGFSVDDDLVGGGTSSGLPDPGSAQTLGLETGTAGPTGRPTVAPTGGAVLLTTPDLITAEGTEDGAVNLDLISLLADAGGTPVTVVLQGVPEGVSFSLGSASGDGVWTINNVTEADLGGLALSPPPNFGGNLVLDVTVLGADGGELSAATLSVDVAPVADVPTLEVVAARGDEDAVIPLTIAAASTDPDGSELLDVAITDIPDGATLTFLGTDVVFDPDGLSETPNTLEVFGADQSQLSGLTLTPPPHSDDDFDLTVAATTREGGTAATTIATLVVEVDPVADTPVIGATDTEGDADSAIPLDVNAALIDVDGSETLSVTISGVPAGHHQRCTRWSPSAVYPLGRSSQPVPTTATIPGHSAPPISSD